MSRNAILALALTVTSMTGALAQPPGKTYRLGLLSANQPAATWRSSPQYRSLFEGLQQLGYVEGRNLAIEYRSAEGKMEHLPELATELLALKVDVLWVGTCGALLTAAMRATTTTPIVVAACADDMVAAGIVQSLAHPGGNVTGTQKLTPELAAKRLELLKEVVPKASRVAILWDPAYSDFAADWARLRAAARSLGVTLLPVEAKDPTEFESSFSTMVAMRADALITFSDAMTYVHRQRLVDLAFQHRLAMMTPFEETTTAGGLISYGPSILALMRHSAVFIDQILKGTKAGDIAIEQPTKFDLVINLKTAKALGLTIPQSLLLRADEVIQ
jgi:putative tryptophan/tyrosine transport system substrate-binding protein